MPYRDADQLDHFPVSTFRLVPAFLADVSLGSPLEQYQAEPAPADVHGQFEYTRLEYAA